MLRLVSAALTAVLLSGCGSGDAVSSAGARSACEAFHEAFAEVPGVLTGWRDGSFRYDAAAHDGCVVTVVGDTADMADGTPPAHLVHPESNPAFDSWEADLEADGKDGTSFRLRRQGIFCAVEGWWDGGDDQAPDVPRSTLFLISISCAVLT